MTVTGRLAAFLGPGQPMQLREHRVADPEPGAVVVRVRQANVCGSDLHQWSGEFDLAAFGRPYPQVLGHEMTGTVHALGRGVTRDSAGAALGEGDRVVYRYFRPCGSCRACLRGTTRACPDARAVLRRSCDEPPHFTGAFADYHHLEPGTTVLRVPDRVPDAAAAGANCALAQMVAAFDVAALAIGEAVVLQGAGGLGLVGAAVARARGAGLVVVVDGVDDRLALARRFGAHVTLDLREHPRAEDRVQVVRGLTGGWGADVVAEVAGDAAVVPEGLAMLGRTGRYLEIGSITPGRTVAVEPSRLVYECLTVHGIVYYEARHLAAAVDLLASTGDVYPWDGLVGRTYPLERVDEAFEAAAAHRASRVGVTTG